MVAKRRLDFSTPARKRQKAKSLSVVYMGSKTEMKYFDTAITHGDGGPVTGSSLPICQIASGSSRLGRVGNKIKIHRVQAMITIDGTAQPIKVELNLPKNTSATPATTFLGLTSQDTGTTFYTRVLHAGTEANPSGFWLNYKLPLGLICTYDGTLGSSINRGNMYLNLATNSTSVIDGFVRVWYTDA